jgi:hypothetical protein
MILYSHKNIRYNVILYSHKNIRYNMILYSHKNIREMFLLVKVHFPTTSILNLTEEPKLRINTYTHTSQELENTVWRCQFRPTVSETMAYVVFL